MGPSPGNEGPALCPGVQLPGAGLAWVEVRVPCPVGRESPHIRQASLTSLGLFQEEIGLKDKRSPKPSTSTALPRSKRGHL